LPQSNTVYPWGKSPGLKYPQKNILTLQDETFTLSQKLGNSYLVPQHHIPEHNPQE